MNVSSSNQEFARLLDQARRSIINRQKNGGLAGVTPNTRLTGAALQESGPNDIRSSGSHSIPAPVEHYQQARLLRWPTPATVPDAELELTFRICALLTRRLTLVHLVHRLLQADEQQTAAILTRLQLAGHIRLSSPLSENARNGQDLPPSEQQPRDDASRPFWQKLWRKLTGSDASC